MNDFTEQRHSIKLKCCEIGHEEDAWWETFSDINDPVQFANDLVSKFNETLRPYEQPRKWLTYEELEIDPSPLAHEWQKTNLVSIVHRNRVYDTYECSQCNITGKRFDLSSVIKRDPKFKALKYDFCHPK